MTAPASGTGTPGQAATVEIHLPVTFDAQDNPHIRQPHTSETGAHEHAKQLGGADGSVWRYEVHTFDLIDDAGAVTAAAAAQPAPYEPAVCKCGHWQAHHAFSEDVCAVVDCPCMKYLSAEQPAPAAAPGLAELPPDPTADELRLAAEADEARAALARVLSWFPTAATRNEASATRAQLAHAYQDGGLTVPDELRRFL